MFWIIPLLFCSMLFSEEKEFRIYDESTPEYVKELYYLNHTKQTVDFVKSKRNEYLNLDHAQMGIWEALDLLDAVVDESDPDIHLSQTYHAFQTAEALRRDGQPRWLILTGLIHDMGKMLNVFGEPQWAVVGDIFPVGCAYSDRVIFPQYFKQNPDGQVPLYQTKFGIYTPHCGFDELLMSWGHDEYFYQVVKDYLPPEVSYIIHYHSFYAAHRDGGYEYFMSDYDREMLPWLQLFSQYDLYSKEDEEMDVELLRPYYEELVREFLPITLNW